MPLPRLLLSSPRRERRRAFTLIELLTVIAIVGVLAGILIPVVGRVRENARASSCASNLRQLGNALHLYAADNNGLFPAPRWREADAENGLQNPTRANWQVEVAPFLALDISTRSFNTSYSDERDSYVFCPEYAHRYRDTTDWGTVQTGGYGMNNNLIQGGAWGYRFRRNQITAPSRTVLLGDSTDWHLNIKADGWPAKITAKPGDYESGDPRRHGSTANYLFVDGRVTALTPDAALVALTRTP